jgi:hypothetical protein
MLGPWKLHRASCSGLTFNDLQLVYVSTACYFAEVINTEWPPLFLFPTVTKPWHVETQTEIKACNNRTGFKCLTHGGLW